MLRVSIVLCLTRADGHVSRDQHTSMSHVTSTSHESLQLLAFLGQHLSSLSTSLYCVLQPCFCPLAEYLNKK